ncbi:MAG: NADPH-dependent F420 reductase [Pseudonocardiales bacterium]|nr:MAG: NADPH-dependent F420 reductase [Pseudonocardiales bacterium]
MPPEATEVAGLVVGILGGTGPQGRGLAIRLAASGQRVLIGSRTPDRAVTAAAEVSAATGVDTVGGADNARVAADADLVVVAVPWDGHAATVSALREELQGKVVVDCVNPLGFDKHGAYALDVAEGSAAEQAQSLLPDSRVVGAFHHLSAVLLADTSVESMDGDVLVVGDDRTATDLVQALAGRIPGLRGVYAGRLRNCGQVEALTANLISVNRRYQAHAGIRITDV